MAEKTSAQLLRDELNTAAKGIGIVPERDFEQRIRRGYELLQEFRAELVREVLTK